MAPSLSRLRNPQAAAAVAAAGAAVLLYMYRKQPGMRTVPTVPKFIKEEKKKDKNRAQVDARFFLHLWRIIRICIPSVFAPEVFYMMLVALSLLGRTYADVWMITNTTSIESGIIQRKKSVFGQYLFNYLMAMPAISIVNNLLKFGLSELKLRFRSRLTTHFYDQYLNGFTYYKMTNIDNRIANADQLLTQDVERFCEGIVDLYSNLSKPLVDVFLYVGKLGNSLGYSVPALLFVYLLIAGAFLTRLRRPIGRMTVTEQQLEGEYRYVNSRLITNSEEIAFYQGGHRERATIKHSFEKLVAHLRKLIMFRFGIGFVDNILAKYAATMVGFSLVARPFFDSQNKTINSADKDELVRIYYDNGRYMVQLASAFGRIALAGREMTRLAGFTARMTELMTVLKDLNKGGYVRTMVSSEKTRIAEAASDEETVILSKPSLSSQAGTGKIAVADHIIKFEHVPLVTPNGDVLIDDMSFEVRSGMNVLVCGPNGCGKSSLFRVLGELWPLFGGTLTKPDKRNLFYIPQRPYMTIGTLRDQIIYPHNRDDLRRMRISDKELEKYLELVQLKYILEREGGWDSVQDWMDVLSGGEKQRIAMARLFYHRPQFAILDECTSAVSVDVEASMYNYCRQANITLFTVSHRKSLWVHHEYYLQMDGRGTYQFAKIDESTKEFGS